MTWTGVILIASNSGLSLLLRTNNRGSGFYLIRGSKLGFLTSFSYLNYYFLILDFSWSHYLLVLLRLSWLHGNPISCPIFSYLWHSKGLRPMWATILMAHIMHFLEARHTKEPGSRLNTGFLSHFHLPPMVSHVNIHWAIAHHTIISHKNPQALTFLHDTSLC